MGGAYDSEVGVGGQGSGHWARRDWTVMARTRKAHSARHHSSNASLLTTDTAAYEAMLAAGGCLRIIYVCTWRNATSGFLTGGLHSASERKYTKQQLI